MLKCVRYIYVLHLYTRVELRKSLDFIFGFCDIREFTAATECLREDVMLFVNGVAQIVHDIVLSNGGYPNKNVGDAFLVVWKPPKDGLQAIKDMGAETNIADKALTSIVQSAEFVNFDSSGTHARIQGPDRLWAARWLGGRRCDWFRSQN